MKVQSIAVIGLFSLKYLLRGLSSEWMLMSAGLKDGKDGSRSVSSFLQHEVEDVNPAIGPRADVM